MARRLGNWWLAATALTLCGGAPAVAIEPGSRGTASAFASLAELESALAEAVGGGDLEAFWHRVAAAGTPLVFGRTAVLLFRGPATTVEWRGDFSEWRQSWDTHGERLGTSDVWRKTIQLLPGSRLDYKIVVDGETWLLDPLNPHQQVGGFGPNSELRMPGWEPSPWVERREGVPRGRFSDDLSIASERLGYAVTYRVWEPPGPAADASELPVLYVTDGSDYWRDEMGGFVIVLDNLYAAGRIRPMLAVFVDPWDREAGVNRREQELLPAPDGTCAFCEFLVEELVPAIDAAYPTDPSAAGRALLGTSYGGLHATFMGLGYPEIFGAVGIQSPAFWSRRWVLERLEAAERFSRRAFLDVGLYERDLLDDARRLGDRLEAMGVELLRLEPADRHSFGHWRTTIDDLLVFLFGRGTPDRPGGRF